MILFFENLITTTEEEEEEEEESVKNGQLYHFLDFRKSRLAEVGKQEILQQMFRKF